VTHGYGALLQALDRYPYGCTEQIVSRALPLLYVNKLAKSAALGIDSDVDQRIREAIERVLARQDSNGAFGLWSSSDSEDMWLHAFVTDFLTRARENHFDVPQKKFDAALERLLGQYANVSTVLGIPSTVPKLCTRIPVPLLFALTLLSTPVAAADTQDPDLLLKTIVSNTEKLLDVLGKTPIPAAFGMTQFSIARFKLALNKMPAEALRSPSIVRPNFEPCRHRDD
jgi:hypothetical protein